MISGRTLVRRIGTVPVGLFIESLPLLYQQNVAALVPAVEAGREDLVRILVLYEPQHIQQAIERSTTPQIRNFLSNCLVPETPEFVHMNQARWFQAAQSGDAEFIKHTGRFYLAARNPDFEQDHRNKTALQEAICNDQTQLIPLLLREQGKCWKNGKTALMMAAERGNAEACGLLCAEVGLQDQYGWNALMYAVDGGFVGCFACLRAEARQRNEFKMTALDIARQRGTEIATQLSRVLEGVE